MIRPALFALCLALPSLVLAQATTTDQVYKWKDANGVVHYSQVEPDRIKAETREVRTITPQAATTAVPKSADELACEKAKINADLLAAKNILTTDVDGDGKPETMSDAERKDAIALNARLLAFHCKPSAAVAAPAR